MATPPPPGTTPAPPKPQPGATQLPQPGATGLPGQGGQPGTPAPPTLPAPEPGKLTDPQGNDISRSDPGSDRRNREKELQDLKPTADPGQIPGGFDVQPAHLYYTSHLILSHQIAFKEHPDRLLDRLRSHPHVCGTGTGPSAFTTAYDEICRLYLKVWAKAVVSIGGVSAGLTITSNNYVAAEYASNPQAGPGPGPRPVPGVITRPPAYGDVTGLGWHQGGSGGSFGDRIIDEVAGVIAHIGDKILRPILKYVLRHGRVADITPGGDDHELPKVAEAWKQIAKDADKSGDDLDAALRYITDQSPGHDEWQAALGQFCSSLWGTTKYGRARHTYDWNHGGGQQPVLLVLMETAKAIAALLDEFKTQVEQARREIARVYTNAAKELVDIDNFREAISLFFETVSIVGLAEEFIENLDKAALNRAVDVYNHETGALAARLRTLEPALSWALQSTPTYEAEEARAQALGARSLTEFSPDHKWTVPAGAGTSHKYPIDLANQEWAGNAHAVDKHVGKTDEQLQQRMQDDLRPNGNIAPSAASSYGTLADAQALTQAVLDDATNDAKITNWLSSPPPPERLALEYDAPDDAITGRTVPKTSPTTYGNPGYATGAKVILLRMPGRTPPFVVLTSYPD